MKTQPRMLNVLAAVGVLAVCAVIYAQPAACPDGYRVVSRHYDAQLHKTWELRQDCLHPEWPARSVAVANSALLTGNSTSLPLASVANIQPLLVRAGEPVRVWSQDAAARIEITGTAEQSARLGERINVRIARQSDDTGLAIQHLAGIVRAANDVEIAQ